jgi:hypothetical protein
MDRLLSDTARFEPEKYLCALPKSIRRARCLDTGWSVNAIGGEGMAERAFLSPVKISVKG